MTDNSLAEQKTNDIALHGKVLDTLASEIEGNFGSSLDAMRQAMLIEIQTSIGEVIEDALIYPERDAPIIHIWAFDRPLKQFDLEKVLLDWFDTEEAESSVTKAQLENWAEKLESIAARLRKAVTEERYTEDEA